MLMVYSLMSRKIPFWDLSCADVNFECSCCIKCLHSGCKPSLVAALSARVVIVKYALSSPIGGTPVKYGLFNRLSNAFTIAFK